jgi:hypothetical protein
MAGESEVVGAQLNVDATAVPSEVEDFQKQLDPNADRQPPEDAGGDDEHDDHADEERSARVDSELDDAPDEAAREKIRERRRQERQNKRARGREKMETLERRLADEKSQRMQLEQRLRNLESTNVNGQMAQLQNAEQQAINAENDLTATIQKATEAQDGATVAEATRRLVQLQNYKTQITNAKTNLERQAARPQQPHLDPEAVKYAADFRKKHVWFKGSNATDEHSRILTAIDNTMFNEGWDPSSEAYWTELESRGRKYLPDRFKAVDNGNGAAHNPSNGRRSPVAGSGGNASNGGGGRTSFRLSEARVRAMKEAGAWDDPTRKAKMIKDYRDYDSKNGLTS